MDYEELSEKSAEMYLLLDKMERTKNYDHELKSIDPSKVIRMITEAEARKIAFDVFTARMENYVDQYKQYIGVEE